MGRRIKIIFSTIIITSLPFLLFIGCYQEDLLDIIQDKVVGWKIDQFSDAVPLIEGFTHEDGTEERNGFPQKLVIADDDTVHVFWCLVSANETLYTYKEPESDQFHTDYMNLGYRYAGGLNPVGVELISNDTPYVAYSARNGTDYDVILQQYNPGNETWSPQDVIYTRVGEDIGYVDIYYLSQDLFDPRIYCQVGNDVYFTQYDNSQITPDPPEVFISNARTYTSAKIGNDDIAFIYTNYSTIDILNSKRLYYRTLQNPEEEIIWEVTDPDLAILQISFILDTDNNSHICVTTCSIDEGMLLDPEYYAITYITNANGSWEVKGTISGNSESGPFSFFGAPAIALTRDTNGDEHLHMVYIIYEPPANMYLWYAYFDDNEWQVSEDTLDPDHTTSFFTTASMVADSKGALHIAYSWAQSELDRTLMYIKGTPEKQQD